MVKQENNFYETSSKNDNKGLRDIPPLYAELSRQTALKIVAPHHGTTHILKNRRHKKLEASRGTHDSRKKREWRKLKRERNITEKRNGENRLLLAQTPKQRDLLAKILSSGGLKDKNIKR